MAELELDASKCFIVGSRDFDDHASERVALWKLIELALFGRFEGDGRFWFSEKRHPLEPVALSRRQGSRCIEDRFLDDET